MCREDDKRGEGGVGMKALLVLADGTIFEGRSFGSPGETMGELVFNTSMMGYQEILTDPSYRGQIVVMTYPLIGNYGINDEDIESQRPWVEGFVVKESSGIASNWRSQRGLDDFLKENGIVGIQGIDTRALTRHIRDKGAQEGVISTGDFNPESLVKKARESKGIVGRDLVRHVTCAKGYEWRSGKWRLGHGYEGRAGDRTRYSVVAYDFGIKYNILRMLTEAGCDVTVVPASTTPAEVLDLNPAGIFLSNGPGDPEGVPYAIEAVKSLIRKRPIFGICLGHQILALALGARTFKLKFGHRGGNQPVMDMTTNKVEITVQNHSFAVAPDTLPDEIELTHINLNDKTAEGMRHRELPIFSVQYHPEASPGPHDSTYLFKRFVGMMRLKS